MGSSCSPLLPRNRPLLRLPCWAFRLPLLTLPHPDFSQRALASHLPSSHPSFHKFLPSSQTPPQLIFSSSHHHIPQSPFHPLPHRPSPPYPTLTQTCFLTPTHQRPPARPQHFQRSLFFGSAFSFSEGNLPFCACLSPLRACGCKPPSRGWRAPSAGLRKISQSRVLQLS